MDSYALAVSMELPCQGGEEALVATTTAILLLAFRPRVFRMRQSGTLLERKGTRTEWIFRVISCTVRLETPVVMTKSN